MSKISAEITEFPRLSVYRFDKPEIQEKMIKLLDLNLSSDFNPYINYDDNKKKIIIYLGKNNFDCIEKLVLL